MLVGLLAGLQRRARELAREPVPVANLLKLKSDFRAGYRIFQRTQGFDRKQRDMVGLSGKRSFRTLATEISDHQ